MRGPSAETLLDLWERGLDHAPMSRNLMLLRASAPEATREELEHWSVGRRDAALLDLRAQVFGEVLQALASCPSCGERLEIELDVDDLRVAGAGAGAAAKDGPRHDWSGGGYRVSFRAPDSTDLEAIAAETDPVTAEHALFERCAIRIEKDGRDLTPGDLTEEAARAVSDAMEAVDPGADLRLRLACPGCSHRWEATLDIGSFLWRELGAWAARALHEVHVLASAYGWSEREILGLGAVRRRTYLELVSE